MQTKPFFASKTVWLNLIAGILAIVTPLVNPDLMTPKVFTIFSGVVAVLNLILRTFSTATPIVPPKQ